MKIEIDQRELDRAIKTLESLGTKAQREILVKSVNDTLRNTLESMRSDLPKFIDRPKAITLRSLYAAFANYKFMNGFIEFKAHLGKKLLKRHWLAPLVLGGQRSEKGLDRALKSFGVLPSGYTAIPTKDIRLDGFGNVRGNYVTRMLSFLKMDMSSTQNRNSKKPKSYKQKWFVAGFNNSQKIKPGIYEYSSGALGRRVRMVFMFKQVTYKKTYPFFETANTYASKLLPLRIAERIKSAMFSK